MHTQPWALQTSEITKKNHVYPPLAGASGTLSRRAARCECCWKPADRLWTQFILFNCDPPTPLSAKMYKIIQDYTRLYKIIQDYTLGALEVDRAIEARKPL